MTTDLAVTHGGTGLSSGTDGGILGFTATGTIASSALLAASQVMLGGGAGSTPTTLAAGTDNFVLRMGSSNPTYEVELLSKDANITSPTTSEDAVLFYTPIAITITELRVIVKGTSSPSVTAVFNHHTDRSEGTPNIMIPSNTYNSTTTGEIGALTSDITVPAASFIWMVTTATVGTVDEMGVHIRYTID